MPDLQAGPDHWQVPTQMRCDNDEPGPFCGVHIIELATGATTTLVSRDRATWSVLAGKTETPTTLEFVKIPQPPDLLRSVEPLFRTGPGAFVSVAPAHPLVPEPFTLPDVRGFMGGFVVLGDKLYTNGRMEESSIVEIDPKRKTSRALALSGKLLLGVMPGGAQLALYLAGKRTRSVATYDVVAEKIVTEREIPRELAAECRREHHYYDDAQAYYLPATGRFYVGFSCFPDA
jgi:hypothetical protein